MSVNLAIFDPFKDVLADGERLRLKDGVLTVEKSDVRSTHMSGWTRFWTRGQYSQSAILKEMGKLYKQAQNNLGEDEQRDTFIKNFATLEGRATAQNEKFKDVSSIVRFFKAKSFIDVASFHKKFQKVDDAIIQAVNDKRQAAADAAQRLQDEADAAEAQIRLQEQRQAQAEAARVARLEQQQADFDAQVKPIKDKLVLYTNQLEELENCSFEVYKENRINDMLAQGQNPDSVTNIPDWVFQMSYANEIQTLNLQISATKNTIESLSH